MEALRFTVVQPLRRLGFTVIQPLRQLGFTVIQPLNAVKDFPLGNDWAVFYADSVRTVQYDANCCDSAAFTIARVNPLNRPSATFSLEIGGEGTVVAVELRKRQPAERT